MDIAEDAPLRAWLADERASAVDPEAVAALRGRLQAGERDVAFAETDGGWTCWHRLGHGPRRRLLEFDVDGNVVALFRWSGSGALREAWVRIPPVGFVGIMAGGGEEGRDEICLAAAPGPGGAVRSVGGFTAIDYERIDEIPVLPEPGRLAAHAGTAILNVLATLAADGGSGPLRYSGPYPSEALFLALLESFRYAPEVPDALRAFAEDRLQWWPAPHRRRFAAAGLYVQRRGRVEKVVWRGRPYHRPDWQGVARHAPRRIHEEGGELRCSLWGLGQPLLTSLRLDRDGGLLEAPAPPPSSPQAHPFDTILTRGLESVVVAQSAPALGTALREVLGGVAMEWGPVDGDLVESTEGGLRISNRLLDALVITVRAASTRERRLALALAALTEVGALVGDDLRARAQAVMLERSPAEQAQAVSAVPEPPSAPAIVAAVEALMATALPADAR